MGEIALLPGPARVLKVELLVVNRLVKYAERTNSPQPLFPLGTMIYVLPKLNIANFAFLVNAVGSTLALLKSESGAWF